MKFEYVETPLPALDVRNDALIPTKAFRQYGLVQTGLSPSLNERLGERGTFLRVDRFAHPMIAIYAQIEYAIFSYVPVGGTHFKPIEARAGR